jgi:hypothetical protein
LLNPCSYIIYRLFRVFCGDPGVCQSLLGPLFRLLGRLGGLLLEALVIGWWAAGGKDGHAEDGRYCEKTHPTLVVHFLAPQDCTKSESHFGPGELPESAR